ncbi:ankyrin repeat domain-containing protein [Alisedimentitalea sp. MJ-SS2]|uniref:ankyrin repeat domain-containing protein n=1 Tax=Aliisedimentitalea sp. MJ-SS2 TaxID=3049795 RepID=UPI002906B20D|nr:ankyrin repeat domain-containing protein [Alisedimentitalea sp. MJ-SS2]MDU8929849.1 ankyrin repeat domain-containing protein [Alisedimentitalea sp. MJ-SS2]
MKRQMIAAVLFALWASTGNADDCGQFCEMSFWKDRDRPPLEASQIEGRDLDALLPITKKRRFTLAQLSLLFYRWEDVVFLIEAGADPNVFSSRGDSLLGMTATKHLGITAHMADSERDAKINERMDRVLYLLEKGADPTQVTEKSDGIMHYMSWQDENYIIGPLIAHLGLDVNDRNSQGFAPIHLAALRGGYPQIYTLAKIGADVNLPLENGETPLHLVAGQNYLNYNTVPALLEYRADPNVRDNGGQTPLHALAGGEEPDAKALDCLFIAGAELDAQDNNGDTALHLAVREGHGDIASALMALGADRRIVNLQGETPWQAFLNRPADVEYFGGDPLALRNGQPVTYIFSSIPGFRTGPDPVCELTYRK